MKIPYGEKGWSNYIEGIRFNYNHIKSIPKEEVLVEYKLEFK